MGNYCPFCHFEAFGDRVFYDDQRWFAILAAPQHTQGHTILLAKKLEVQCPTGLDIAVINGLDEALAKVAKALLQYYRPKDILVASVRGDLSHAHFHLIPLWVNEEREWRSQHLYESGHLLEYLGELERNGDEMAAIQRINRGWSSEEQRAAITTDLQGDVEALKTLCSTLS